MTTSRNFSSFLRLSLAGLVCAVIGMPADGFPALPGTPSGNDSSLVQALYVHYFQDGAETKVVLQGDRPLPYSISSSTQNLWSIRLEGVDSSQLEDETIVGSPQLDRILVRSQMVESGKDVTEIDFLIPPVVARNIRQDGTDLVVEFFGRPEPQDPAVVQAAATNADASAVAIPAVGVAAPPVRELSIFNDDPPALDPVAGVALALGPEDSLPAFHAGVAVAMDEDAAGVSAAEIIEEEPLAAMPLDMPRQAAETAPPPAAFPALPMFQPNSVRLSAGGRSDLALLESALDPQALVGYVPGLMAELPSETPVAPQLGLYDLVVAAGRSLPVQLDSSVTRVSVTNPEIADAVVISPEEILLNGISPGNTSMVLWFKQGGIGNYNVIVETDPAPLQMRLRQFFPNENISVGASRQTIVLYGTVSRPEVGDKAVKISSDYSLNVVNNLTFPPEGRSQVMLKVVFAEVNRQAITELSTSFSRIDPNNLRNLNEGLSSTGGQTTSGNQINVPRGPDFTFNENINFYAFSFGEKISAFITALKTRGLAQVLAEPTLTAADGEKASFLAGGEFPIPVAQAGAGFTSVTIVFKKFGISLDFTPNIRPDGTIVLQVEPEVSALDFANAVVLSGFTVPSLTVRRASTQIELRSGQSFAIAGLYSSDLQQTKKKIPLLGDIPLLGYLFRSKNLNKNKSELLVMVTPTLVEPIPEGETIPLPKFHMGFELNRKDKDAHSEVAGTAQTQQE